MRIALALSISGLLVQAASAQQCASTQKVFADLEKLGEVVVWEGFEPDKPISMLVVVQNPQTQAWTAVRVAGAVSCVMARGTDGTEVTTGQGA